MSACSEPASATIARRIAEKGLDILSPRLLADPPGLPLIPRRGDYDLNPYARREVRDKLIPAAVLIPIVRRTAPTVLFTRRTEHLARHAGQVSFPGGRLDDQDLSLVETAFRETREETGIGGSLISVAGFLEPYETGTGFAILPVVGLLDEGFTLFPDRHEVAEIFEVPLAYLLDDANCERQSGEWQGANREFYSIHYERHHIWGATAAIVVNLRERLCQ